MPISYSIDRQNGVIHEVWVGEIWATDLEAYWVRYLADPDVLVLRRTLVDLRNAKIKFTGLEVSALVRRIVIPALKGRHWLTAVLVATPVQMGTARQYQVFAESYSRDAIFHDYDRALDWLMQQELRD